MQSQMDTLAQFSSTGGIANPVLWGDPNVVKERLGDSVIDLTSESRLYPRFGFVSSALPYPNRAQRWPDH